MDNIIIKFIQNCLTVGFFFAIGWLIGSILPLWLVILLGVAGVITYAEYSDEKKDNA